MLLFISKYFIKPCYAIAYKFKKLKPKSSNVTRFIKSFLRQTAFNYSFFEFSYSFSLYISEQILFGGLSTFLTHYLGEFDSTYNIFVGGERGFA